MVDMTGNEDKRAVIKSKLRQNFDGKIVRKDLTKKKRLDQVNAGKPPDSSAPGIKVQNCREGQISRSSASLMPRSLLRGF